VANGITDLLIDGLRSGLQGGGATLSAAAGDLLSSSDGDPLDERDPDFIRDTLPLYRRIVDLYFRPDVRGLEHVPAEGPVLLVGNHSGGLYIADTFAFAYAFAAHCGPERQFHQLVHDLAVKLPGLSAMLRKYGGVPASHEHAKRAFERGAAVLVYPGGDYETFRPSTHSSDVEFGGRSGFVRLAISENVPIVPVVAIGGQETALFVTRGQRLAKLLRLDQLTRIKVFPVQIAPPFGVTVLDLPARIPLPSQLTVQVLAPIKLRERFGPRPDEDDVYEAVTDEMQQALDRLAEERDLPVVGRVWSSPAEAR
jgi:1-acyl-sn-glycerol-3-phosphate acyltransferase